MISSKLAVSALFAVLVIAQAAPKINNYGGSTSANISGQQTGFRSGFVRQGGKSGRHGGQSNNEWEMEMGQRSCQAPTCYTPQTTNDTINKINALWATYVVGTTNCSSIQEREYAIVKDASDQYVAARVSALFSPYSNWSSVQVEFFENQSGKSTICFLSPVFAAISIAFVLSCLANL